MTQGSRVAMCLAALMGAVAAQAAPAGACGALRSLTGFGFTVATAQAVPASRDAAEHCKATGQILPEIRFEVYLPANWNKRFLLLGNGGFAGTMNRGAAMRATLGGFATAVTDTGHDAAQEPLARFAVNRQKLYDYAFRSLHTTAMAAKQIVAAHYGAAPERSYYNGCSTGGRQGLILAQRFPEDFDGIIAGAPVLDFTGTMLQYVQIAQALAEAPIPLAKMQAVASAVYKQCDAKDGLEDGLIDDPRRCGFSAARDLPKCAPGEDKPDCLTGAQLRTIEKIYSPVVANGQTLMEGWPVSAEVAGPNGRSGWAEWILKDTGPTIGVNFATSFFRYMAFEKRDESLELSQMNLDRDSPLADWLRPILDARETDLSAFRARGGKLIMFYGWGDPALNPMMGVNYYEGVLKTMAAPVQEFFRFFLVPGMFHCSGGVGCGSFDMLPPLMEWVEKGKAPQQVIGARMVEGKRVRSRPLCPYPQTAKYQGSGSIDEASNFRCAAP